jgi:nucleoside-diphosphate-sugar epimerase
MKVLLAGFGYVAQRLAPRLAGAGIEWSAHGLRARAGARALDLDAPVPAASIDVDGSTVVYSIAPQPSGDEDLRIGRWLRGLAGRPRRLIYLSTTGVYGSGGVRAADEDTPAAPTQARGRRRVSAERQLQAWCLMHGVDRVVLRLPAIYGPLRLPLERLRRGDPVLDPAVAPPSHRIHVDDLVAVIERALSPSLPAGIYLVRDDSDWPLGAWFARVAALARLPAPERVGPQEAARRLSPGMLEFMREGRALDDRRSRQLLALSLRYADPEDGVRASLAEMAAGEEAASQG